MGTLRNVLNPEPGDASSPRSEATAYRELFHAFATGESRMKIAARVARLARAIARADSCCVIFNHGSDYEYVAGCGCGEALIGLKLARGTDHTSAVLESGRPSAFVPLASDTDAQYAAGVRSGVAAPIIVHGRVFGTLELGFRDAEPAAPRRIELLSELAEYLAIGLALTEAEELKRSFVQSVMLEIQADRRRIARDLHDETGQLVSAMMVRLAALEHRGMDAGTQEQIHALQLLGARLHGQLRKAVMGLRETPQGEQSIEQAVRTLCQEQAAVHGFTATVACNGLLRAPELPLETQAAVYRIVQEGITNAAKHGRARTVSLVIHRASGRLRLILEDDGCGFDCEAPQVAGRGHGLKGMRERLALLGGSLVVESTPGVGTTLYADLPDRGASRP